MAKGTKGSHWQKRENRTNKRKYFTLVRSKMDTLNILGSAKVVGNVEGGIQVVRGDGGDESAESD